MANELNIQLDPFNDSGLTLIAKGFNPDGTQLGSDVTMTEVGSRAYYTASFSLTGVADGAYLISFETATQFYGSGVLYVKDGDELDLSDVETETLAAGRETNIISEVNANETKIDLIETKAQADSRQAILVGEHNDTQADIAALNDFNPATDTVANVTLVDTTTTNTDMRGTDGANTIAPDNTGITQIQTDISNLNDITAAEVYTEFTTGTNEDAFKADVSALATQSSVDTIDSVVDGIAVQTTRVDGLIENSSGDRFTAKALETAPTDEISETEFHDALDSYQNKNSYKADVSALATEANATTNKNSIIAEVDGNETKIDIVFANVLSILTDTSTTIPAQISALNDLSEAQVKAQADQALVDYDPPTKAELDTAVDDIIAEIIPASNIADAVWDEPYNQHTTAGTFGKLMDILRKANRAIEGEVTGTPTTTSFTTNMTGYVTGAFNSEVMVFVSGTINGEARPILSYNATNGTFNFEEAWTQAPSANDEFIILPYHVHAISEIQNGLAKTTELNAVETAILNAISGLNDLDQQEVAQAVWDYLQSSTTVSASMKEAVLKILVNANLIPATI